MLRPTRRRPWHRSGETCRDQGSEAEDTEDRNARKMDAVWDYNGLASPCSTIDTPEKYSSEDKCAMQELPMLAISRCVIETGGGSPTRSCSSTVQALFPRLTDQYLWACVSDAEIVEGIENTLRDPERLDQECRLLFNSYLPAQPLDDAISPGDPMGADRLEAEPLQELTQSIIDKLGCRSEPVLERISLIYHTVLTGCPEPSLRYPEFKGYVAALLTQIQRELADRSEESCG